MIILPLTNCDDPPSVACRHLEVLPKTLASPFPIRWSSPRCGNGIFGMGGSEINVHLAVHLPCIPSMRCDACCKEATVSGKNICLSTRTSFFLFETSNGSVLEWLPIGLVECTLGGGIG